jgi:sugar phosphate isomerase/epimerase
MTISPDPSRLIDDPAQLVASAATLASSREPAPAQAIRKIIDAVTAVGFGGLSIWTDQFDWAVADGMSPEEYLAYHHDRGLSVPAAEVVFLDWAPRWSSEATAGYAHQLDVTARMGAHTMIAVVLDPEPSVGRRADAGLGQLCDLAADRGLHISFEFLPWSGVPSLRHAVDLLELVDRDNLRLTLDSWHWVRQPGGPDESLLRSLPPHLIDIVQLCDAPLVPVGDLAGESQLQLLPGDGAVDNLGLLDLLEAMGARPVLASEVFSTRLLALGPAENARRQFAAARDLVQQHLARRPSVS